MASTNSDMVTIYLLTPHNEKVKLEIPTNLNISLMEVLKADNYPIPGTCGGIALCATCAVEIIAGGNYLSPATDQELDMIDLLPNNVPNTRLACQIRISQEMDGMVIRLNPQH